ncbi:MAG: RNA polymerase sigma factor [Planctomycetes bacterium]|nr:RNA polymerase sigma factor [Planctomycetota bacterium]
MGQTSLDLPVDILERCARRDEAAWRLLTERLGPRLFRIALRLVRDRAEASDVTQEAFLRGFRSLGRMREAIRDPAAWFARIALRAAADRLRARSTRAGGIAQAQEMDLLPDPRAPDPPGEVLRRERARLLEEAIGLLPERQRAAVVLFELEGLSLEEAAGIMETTSGNVKSLVHLARNALRAAFDLPGVRHDGVSDG